MNIGLVLSLVGFAGLCIYIRWFAPYDDDFWWH